MLILESLILCHCTNVGTISRRIVPLSSNFLLKSKFGGGLEKSTARRWHILAPRSWPRRIIGMREDDCCEGDWWRTEWRGLRIDRPVLRL